MEYSNLLDQADECEDPYMRLVYAGEQTFLLNPRQIPVPFDLKTIHVLVCTLQHLGQYLSTMLFSAPGSLLIPFLVKPMKWLTIMGLLFFQSRSVSLSLNFLITEYMIVACFGAGL